jgi:acetyl-CoA carboxylase biotin carboxyl carrier protein
VLKDELKELLEFVRNTDLQEVHWERKGTTLSFKRSASAPGCNTAANTSASEEDIAAEAPKAPEKLFIRSTMVGTFYRSDSPDRPPMVVEGTIVSSGQAVASIEAMKIRKDVTAAMPCRIVKSLVTNNHPVEYGQPLFEVEPADNV